MRRTRSAPHDGPRASHGFTLIELMIVIAIIGILAGVAIPQYQTYSKRTRFSEVVMATGPYKTTTEIAVHTGRASTVDDLDAGAFGIPVALGVGETVARNVATVSMENGLITATGTGAVDNAVYALQATLTGGGMVIWSVDNTVTNACEGMGLC